METPLPKNCQHLFGIVNIVAPNLAVVHGDKTTPHIANILHEKAIETIVLKGGRELNNRLGMNFVTLAPNKIVMPAGAPDIKKQLTNHGIEVHEIVIDEYLKAAGGLACLTGILRRDCSSCSK